MTDPLDLAAAKADTLSPPTCTPCKPPATRPPPKQRPCVRRDRSQPGGNVTLSVQDWIREVDELRKGDELLARGYWHGYRDAPGASSRPMRGKYYLVRWEEPTIAVSHDFRDEVVRLARVIEAALERAA
jgi:hypothetical protein